jgi:hypothetical protein
VGERQLRRFLALSAVAYGVGAALFAARPDGTARDLGLVGGSPPEPARLWNALSVAYMATIATTAAVAARDPLRHAGALPVLVAAKVTSSAMLADQYRRTGSRGYLVGVATDLPLAVATAALYWRARRERSRR